MEPNAWRSVLCSIGRRTVLMLAIAFATVCGARAQMEDGSWVYDDNWADSSFIWGYGETSAGWLAEHSYAVEITITSPLGRESSMTTGFSQFGNSTTAVLDWNFGDFGDYVIRVKHRTFCNIVMAEFLFAAVVLTQRPPGEPCSGEGTWTCNERNTETPLSTMKGDPQCKQYSHCCVPFMPAEYKAWCRTETCNKCTGQTNYPVNSVCRPTKLECERKDLSWFCLGSPCQ